MSIDYRRIGLSTLMEMLEITEDQDKVNKIALEIANRLYVRGVTRETYEEFLEKLGYKKKVYKLSHNQRRFKNDDNRTK